MPRIKTEYYYENGNNSTPFFNHSHISSIRIGSEVYFPIDKYSTVYNEIDGVFYSPNILKRAVHYVTGMFI